MAKIDTWIDLANLYYQAGALDKAIAAYLKIIKQGCSFGSVYNNLANAYASQGNVREAIPHFQKCIELLSDPRERAVISIRLGECHRQVGEYDNAITAFKKAFEIDPGNPAVLKGLGDIQSDLENMSPADEPVKDIASETGEPAGQQPQPSPAPLNAAISSLDKVDDGPHTDLHSSTDGSGLPFTAEMLAANPEQDDGVRATMLLTLGIMHWRNGSLDEACQIIQSAIDVYVKIQNNQGQALCWHTLALIKTDQGHIETAIGAYRQAVSLAPDQIFPWGNIGNLYNSMGRSDEAMLAFHRALKQNPEDTASWDGLGDIYTKLGRLDDGIAAYQLGNIFEKRPQGPDAIKAYEKAFQLYKFTLKSLDSKPGNNVTIEAVTAAEEETALASPVVQDKPASLAEPISAEPPALEIPSADESEIIPVVQELDVQPGLVGGEELDEPEPVVDVQMVSAWSAVDVNEHAGDTPLLAEQLASPAVSAAPALLEQNGLPTEKSNRTAPENPARQNDPERVTNAIASFLKVVEINPENDRAWDSLGNLYRITQRIGDAIYAFEKATSLDPNKYLYRYQLGTSYAADGNYAAAIGEIRKALELNPAFVFAHCALASFLRKMGQQEEAQKHIALAAPLMMNQKEYDRACFESIRGNTSEALDLLKIALEKKQTTTEWIRRDLDLDFIRSDPRFEKLASGFAPSVVEYERGNSR